MRDRQSGFRLVSPFGCGVAMAAALAASAWAQPSPTAPKPWAAMTTAELVAAAPAEAWVDLPFDQLAVLDFEPAPGVAPVRVVIALAPDFAPRHVAGLKGLMASGAFNAASIVRSQDNYVAQWSATEGLEAKGSPPVGIAPEFDRAADAAFTPEALADGDVYARRVGFWRNWPVAWDMRGGRAWLPHCYGMVGAGRDSAPDSGGPHELYAVNGHAPRALDRNVTLLGRVVVGMEHLSTLPRGTEALGFYGSGQTRPRIIRMALATDLPEADRPRLQAMRTDHPIYGEVLESRRNRRDTWTVRKAGRLEICNAPLPVRPTPAG